MKLVISLVMIYLVPNTILPHWIYLFSVAVALILAYLLFMKKYYHLHEDNLAGQYRIGRDERISLGIDGSYLFVNRLYDLFLTGALMLEVSWSHIPVLVSELRLILFLVDKKDLSVCGEVLH